MKFITYIILFFTLAYNLYSQSLNIFDVDISKFPIIKAKFLAFDANNNPIRNITQSDLELKENGIIRQISFMECPPSNPPIPLSSVLVLDASGSMAGKNLLIAKDAARAFVNGIMNPTSETAITKFEKFSMILSDFSKDKNKLLDIIDKFAQNPSGFTNYDAAMIDGGGAAINIAKYGKQKKIIVFLTDGQPNDEPRTMEIINEATKYNIKIYTVTIKISAPQSLKDMAIYTGGKWFELVKTEEDAKKIYQQILEDEQGAAPCEIVWQSEPVCSNVYYNVDLKLKTNNSISKFGYQIPVNGIMKLEINPTTITFLNAKPNVKVSKFVTVWARNADFNVSNIVSSNSAFTISPTSFQLKKGQNIDLQVDFIPPDSGFISTRFDLYNDKCAASFSASGGFPGKHPFVKTLKVIHPNGNEVFPAGMDTIITWEGVLPQEKVRIEYSTNNGSSWILITENASGNQYKWTVPKTPSKSCIARVTTKEKYHGFDNDWIQIWQGGKRFYMTKYEVTQKQYKEVMLTNPSYFNGDDLPVEQVSWFDAIVFCNRLSDLNGLKQCYTINGENVTFDNTANGYRLPTLSEWEYACRAGTNTHTYNGNIIDIAAMNCTIKADRLDEIAWYCFNSGDKTHQVGTKKPNNYGLYDMSGNVYEWVWDWADLSNPSQKILKGGSYLSFAEYCKTLYKNSHFPNYVSSEFGFRLAKN